jgi:hypothetical protein
MVATIFARPPPPKSWTRGHVYHYPSWSAYAFVIGYDSICMTSDIVLAKYGLAALLCIWCLQLLYREQR